jgi:hypothetical protein
VVITLTSNGGTIIDHFPITDLKYRLDETAASINLEACGSRYFFQLANLTISGTTTNAEKIAWVAANLPQSIAVSNTVATNLTQVNGTAVATQNGNYTAGTQRVIVATNQPPLTLKPQGNGSENALTRYRNTALSNTAQTIKSSAGNIYGVNIINPGASIAYVKFFDAASVTVGTTAPVFVLQVAAGAQVIIGNDNVVPLEFFQTNSIKVAAVTTLADAGNTAPSTALYIEVKYL